MPARPLFQDAPVRNEPKGRAGLVLSLTSLVLLAALGLWLLASFGVLAYFAWTVPLSQQDLAMASWLGSPSSALHFTTGFMGSALLATFLVMGAAMSYAKTSPMPLLSALLMAGALNLGASEQAMVRMGVLDGAVRLGCFVPESRECLVMLGLDASGAPSRYDPSGQNAAWYEERISPQRAKVTQWALSANSIPGGAVLRALPNAGRTGELTERLARQRAPLQRLREQSDAASATR